MDIEMSHIEYLVLVIKSINCITNSYNTSGMHCLVFNYTTRNVLYRIFSKINILLI